MSTRDRPRVPESRPAVLDLRAALVEVREASLTASAWISLANRAVLDGQPPAYVRLLVGKAEEAALAAFAPARAIHDVVSLACDARGRM